ncbi:MAG: hypothetical protein H8E16_02545 [Flavobacteriales bacterium]|nr:hypothetical protein [Flavobacteriales bacterium]
MSNLENQLDLFHGVVLTTEQEQEIATWIENQAKRAANCQEDINRIMLMLDEAGFVQGKDYDSNFEVHEVTTEKDFGYSYNNTNYEYEVTYLNACGSVYLKVNTVHEGKIKIYNSTVSREGNKLMCTSVTSQYRYYKPSSLLVKYNEHNSLQNSKLNRMNAEDVAIKNVIAKFQKQYPKAIVTRGSDYYRRSYTSFPIVKVKFESGSEVSFTLGYSGELEKVRFHKKYDAVSESTEALMERFNNQKAK